MVSMDQLNCKDAPPFDRSLMEHQSVINLNLPRTNLPISCFNQMQEVPSRVYEQDGEKFGSVFMVVLTTKRL